MATKNTQKNTQKNATNGNKNVKGSGFCYEPGFTVIKPGNGGKKQPSKGKK